MDRKKFMQLMALGGAGLVMPFPISSKSLEASEEAVFWPLLGRLILTTAVTQIVGKAIDYVYHQLVEEEKPEPQQIITHIHNTFNFTPVYEYDHNDNDYLFAGGHNGSTDRTFFFSKSPDRNNLRQKCADIRKPELGGLVELTEFYKQELNQSNSMIKQVLLPRTVKSRRYSSDGNLGSGSCIYNTLHGKVAIRFFREAPSSMDYGVTVDFSPAYPTHHTTDARYKSRSIRKDISLG